MQGTRFFLFLSTFFLGIKGESRPNLCLIDWLNDRFITGEVTVSMFGSAKHCNKYLNRKQIINIGDLIVLSGASLFFPFGSQIGAF